MPLRSPLVPPLQDSFVHGGCPGPPRAPLPANKPRSPLVLPFPAPAAAAVHCWQPSEKVPDRSDGTGVTGVVLQEWVLHKCCSSGCCASVAGERAAHGPLGSCVHCALVSGVVRAVFCSHIIQPPLPEPLEGSLCRGSHAMLCRDTRIQLHKAVLHAWVRR
jgi:hypothetical protein